MVKNIHTADTKVLPQMTQMRRLAAVKQHVNQTERRTAVAPVRAIIEVLAKRRGRKMIDLANGLEISRNALYSKLHGSAPFELVELKKIADLLEIDAPMLLRHPDDVFMFSWAPERDKFEVEEREWVAGESNPEPADGWVVKSLCGHLTDSWASLQIAA